MRHLNFDNQALIIEPYQFGFTITNLANLALFVWLYSSSVFATLQGKLIRSLADYVSKQKYDAFFAK